MMRMDAGVHNFRGPQALHNSSVQALKKSCELLSGLLLPTAWGLPILVDRHLLSGSGLLLHKAWRMPGPLVRRVPVPKGHLRWRIRFRGQRPNT